MKKLFSALALILASATGAQAADPILYVRGSSTTAYRSTGGSAAGLIGTTSVDADAGALSGSNINLDQGSIAVHSLTYPGRNNMPIGRAISVHIRLKFGYSGTPSASVGIFSMGGVQRGAQANNTGIFELTHVNTSGNLQVTVGADDGNLWINNQTIKTGFSPVAGTWYDLVLTWTGTNSAAGCVLYQDAVSIGTLTAGGSTAATRSQNTYTTVSIGLGIGVSTTRIKVDEFSVWEGVINPSSVALVGGSGALNGASRTALIAATAGDLTTYTDPGIANVRSGTAYTAAGVSKTGTAAIPVAADVRSGTSTDATTGTLAVPSAANVLSGVSVDATTGTYVGPSVGNVKTGVTYGASSALTGTYDGSDRWTDPGIANVRSSTAYKANSTSNNMTGTAAIPAAADVRSGTATDATTGTASIPIAANVRSGTATDATTGTLAVPAASNVLSGISVDATTGTYVGPSTGTVKAGTTYGASSGLTGTYDGSDRWSDPGTTNVRSGTSYKANSTTNNRTGSAAIPATINVKVGVATGSGTGTYDGSDRWTDPGIANVRLATAYKANSTSNNRTGTMIAAAAATTQIGTTADDGAGTYDGSDRWTDPGQANVRLATAYKANSTSNNRTGAMIAAAAATTQIGTTADDGTGTYDGSDRWSDPGSSNVRSLTAYKANSTSNNMTGTASIPVPGDVRSGVGIDATTGSLEVPSPDQVLSGTLTDDTVGDYITAASSVVKIGTVFGANGALTGTYDGSDRWTALPPSQVQNNVIYLSNAISKTGTLTSVTNIMGTSEIDGPENACTLEAM